MQSKKVNGIFFVNTIHSCIGSRFAFLRTEAGLNPPLEEFTSKIEMIKFNVKINGDLYEITFEKTDNGELVVTGLVRLK